MKANSAAMAISSRPAFTPNCFRVMAQVMQTSAMHIITPILAVTEPTALPTAMSTLPSSAANTDTSISGSVVAKLTTVAPMMNLGMPEASAIHVDASTNQSPPLMMHRRHSPNRTRIIKRLLPVKSRPMRILLTE